MNPKPINPERLRKILMQTHGWDADKADRLIKRLQEPDNRTIGMMSQMVPSAYSGGQ